MNTIKKNSKLIYADFNSNNTCNKKKKLLLNRHKYHSHFSWLSTGIKANSYFLAIRFDRVVPYLLLPAGITGRYNAL